MGTIHSGRHTFRSECDLVDVTSLDRPDPSWRFVDAHGHEHCWYVESQYGPHVPASVYDVRFSYVTPTLIWVKDGEEWWPDDDEPYEVGHLECRQCGEHIRPRSKPDDTTQYIPGMRHFYVDDQPVTKEEFERIAREDGLLP